MSGMEQLKMVFKATVAACIFAVPAGILLALTHAALGWYVGVCALLAGFAVWYAMAPPPGGVRTGDRQTGRHSSVPRHEDPPDP